MRSLTNNKNRNINFVCPKNPHGGETVIIRLTANFSYTGTVAWDKGGEGTEVGEEGEGGDYIPIATLSLPQ